MKKIYLYIIIIFFLYSIGCTSDETENELISDTNILYIENDSEKKNTKDAVVTMHVKEGTVSSTGLTYILVNNTDMIYFYGHEYCISKKTDGFWKPIQIINNDVAFRDTAISLNPNQTTEVNLYWFNFYGELQQGVYKIEKTIHNDNRSELALTFEFEIE